MGVLMQCPKCKNYDINKSLDCDGDSVYFVTECKTCGFNKGVRLDINILNSIFSITHYDWYDIRPQNEDPEVYTWIWSHNDVVGYNNGLNYYTKDDVNYYRYFEYGEE